MQVELNVTLAQLSLCIPSKDDHTARDQSCAQLYADDAINGNESEQEDQDVHDLGLIMVML